MENSQPIESSSQQPERESASSTHSTSSSPYAVKSIFVPLVIAAGLIASGAYMWTQGITVEYLLAKLRGEKEVVLVKQSVTGPNVIFQQGQDKKTADFEKLPESTGKAWAAVDDQKLVLVSLDPSKQFTTPQFERILWGAGWLGIGNSDPKSSPDFSKVAVIDGDGRLNLLTADGQHQVKLPAELNVGYLTGWSPDSSKLIVYATGNSIHSTFNPEGMIDPDKLPKIQSLSKNSYPTGFYLIDLTEQKISYLWVLEKSEFITWLDSNRVIVSINQAPQNKYVVFNLANYQLDAQVLDQAFENYAMPQFSVSQDGQKWAITLHPKVDSNSPDNKAQIAYGSFPKVNETIVAEGAFAQIQWPLISPDGSMTMFRKYDVVNGPNFVHLYRDGKEERLFAGLAMGWIDNERFIYGEVSSPGATNPGKLTELFSYNINTKQKTSLYKFTPAE